MSNFCPIYFSKCTKLTTFQFAFFARTTLPKSLLLQCSFLFFDYIFRIYVRFWPITQPFLSISMNFCVEHHETYLSIMHEVWFLFFIFGGKMDVASTRTLRARGPNPTNWVDYLGKLLSLNCFLNFRGLTPPPVMLLHC